MAASIKTCETEAAKAGCELDIDTSGQAVEISLWSPCGKVFAGTGGHLECGIHGNGFQRGFKPDWSKTLADIRRVIEEGVIDCDDPDCEMCHAENEEADTA
jgi:hypothetical protein